MKRTVLATIVAFGLAGGVAFAHGNAEHVRGTVASITDTAITVQVSAKKARTLTLNAKTMIMKGDAHLTLKDVKVGDRVVVDVDKKTGVATEVTLGKTAPASPHTPTTTTPKKG